MSYFEWLPNYNIGVTEIDEQHQRLALIINQLYDAKMLSDHDTRPHLAKIFLDLIDYTKYHFSAEENLMRTHNYPDYERHQQIHHILTQKVIAFYGQFKANQAPIDDKLFEFLKSWLLNHVLNTDQKIAEYLK